MDSSKVEQLLEDDFVGFWPRLLISLIDGAILIGPIYLLNRWATSLVNTWHSEIPILIPWLVYIVYYVYLVSKFGGTPGRLLLRTRIIDANGNYPTITQALLRYGFYIINFLFTVITTFASHGADQITVLNFLMTCVFIIDGLFIIFMVRNQALHDKMAGTYVVYKSGLDYAEAVHERS
ncbi:RDD family protein [Paenibacillus sp. 19GGS1-52]|uniref:RDD family protein n=1 Tax=Paenibacillus sp. 19GGS1-52 TaxID=2758563 RepID=UPI001EFB9DC5|nr:RDD family protein [Paenibacillus sp. 19GGS1-52]ULO06570.1 RDD family protein [Paenibacillus sp. 19GGS1-52]